MVPRRTEQQAAISGDDNDRRQQERPSTPVRPDHSSQDYEQQRLCRIARNRKRLAKLGLVGEDAAQVGVISIGQSASVWQC